MTALLVNAAATLLESAPFILAAAVLAMAPLRWSSRMVPYLGCGCGSGPSARSIPAAAATWMLFGPAVACARFVCAAFLGAALQSRGHCGCERHSPLQQLASVAPLAAGSAVAVQWAPLLFGFHPAPAAAVAIAAAVAFVMSPCGVGTAGFAAAIRGTAPAASAAFLCIAGLIDLRTWLRIRERDEPAHDALAYALASIACALVAVKHGAGLLHPRLALALWPCAAACAALAVRRRDGTNPRLRIAPAVMLAGAVLSAPPPLYHATETTLAQAFAGERVDFTGLATQTGGATTLVRYAVTCCRADAAPIVLRLARPEPQLHGWVRARGALIDAGGALRLRAQRLDAIPAPADPFVYR